MVGFTIEMEIFLSKIYLINHYEWKNWKMYTITNFCHSHIVKILREVDFIGGKTLSYPVGQETFLSKEFLEHFYP